MDLHLCIDNTLGIDEETRDSDINQSEIIKTQSTEQNR